MLKGNKYTLTTDEYLEMLLYGIEFVDNQEDYIKNANIENEIYKREKTLYESLSDEEKIKVELSDFELTLNEEFDEIRKIEYFLQNGNIDWVCFELSEKIKLYILTIIKKTYNLHFNPPLTQEEINNIAFQQVNNEYSRLYQNIINYKFFLKMLSLYYHTECKITITNQQIIKTSILMFLLVCDYKHNQKKYDNFDFSKIIIHSEINRCQNGKEDVLPVKVKKQQVAKMIRNSASHGEFYLNIQRNNVGSIYKDAFSCSKSIKIQNSGVIPQVSFNISLEDVKSFIRNNFSPDIRIKYMFLINIVNSDDIENVINNEKAITKDNIKELLILTLHNTIQYNTEHHFTDLHIEDLFDLSRFKFFDYLDDNKKEITSVLSNMEKIMNLKNALGHNSIKWKGDILELENKWSSKKKEPVDVMCCIEFNDLIMFFMQQNLYRFSSISQADFDRYHSRKSFRRDI